MKRILIFTLLYFLGISLLAQKQWPVLKEYDQDHLYRIALPIGGIGTGTVSLGGRGELRDWEIMNRPAKGFRTTQNRLNAPFFAIYTSKANREIKTKALLGPLYDWEYQHMEGRSTEHHGMPRFEKASFKTAYPFGQVLLSDAKMPVDVKIKAFNPLIPTDADNSGIPIAVLQYEVTNKLDEQIDVSVCGIMRNFIGVDGSKSQKDWKGEYYHIGARYNKNKYKETGSVKGIYMSSDSVRSNDPAWGTMALTVPKGENITYRTGTVPDAWGNAILNFWDDFSEDGILKEEEWGFDHQPMASLSNSKSLGPKETKVFTFYLTWHFPNRTTWYGPGLVGNYYTELYKDAGDVIDKVFPKLNELENQTIDFVSSFINSDYPEVVKEAALFNISTLRSQTVFRTKDGNMFGWEGTMDDVGSCMGSCTHVWNYEQATAFLFGDLAKSMREVEFGYATHDNGLMSFRVELPLENAKANLMAAADGQMGTIMKFYRDWQLSGDTEFLKKHWPNVKKALAFSWIDGGWDADTDGVMEGCQHNTMDVEYFGPNPQMQLWYLGALKAGQQMALAMDDNNFASICEKLFSMGSKWTDENLFNGEYYEQIIMPPNSLNEIASGLTVGMGSAKLSEPDFQLAKGCLVDQLVGQYMSHICGLGYLVEPKNVKATLESIMKYNYRKSLNEHFNNMRSYAMGNESALLMASWPKGRPKVPFPYFSEVMTGFEYTAAVGMLYEGLENEGLKCIQNIRDRYDGSKRNPFDEAECGHHYARAMASWASVLALSGFNYSAVNEELSFANLEGKYFWSTGHAYGNVIMSNENGSKQLEIEILNGEIDLSKITIKGFGEKQFKTKERIKKSKKVLYTIENNNSDAGLLEYSKLDVKGPTIIKKPVIMKSDGEKISSASFTDNIEIKIKSEPGTNIYYTMDGSKPGPKSNIYNAPIKLSETTLIKAIAEKDGNVCFFSAKAEVFKVIGFKDVKLTYPPSKKYSGKGELTLFDGSVGSSNFSDGRFLGFEQDDMILVIDFGEQKNIKKMSVSSLTNISAWVFPPEKIEFYSSNDGNNFISEQIINKQQIQSVKTSNPRYTCNFDGLNTRYLKIIAKNIGVCPKDHPGNGEKAWFFVDEILIN